MARTIHRVLFLSLLAAACVGGCFLPSADTTNPPADDPNRPTDSTPPQVMLPGIWEANLPGVHQSFTRAIGESGQLEDTITGEQPVQIPIGAEFEESGRLIGLRVLGATGYVNLANPGDRLDEIDYWSDATPKGGRPHSTPIARRHVLEAVDYVGDQITIRLSSSAEVACSSGLTILLPTETHEYSFFRVDDRVSVSASLTSFTLAANDGSGRGANWVLGPIDAVATTDAPEPLAGPWGSSAFNQVYYQFQFPRWMYFDRLGRLVADGLKYPGDVAIVSVQTRGEEIRDDVLQLTGISLANEARIFTYFSRTWPLASGPNDGPLEDAVSLELTGPNSSPQAHEVRVSRSYNTYADGTRELINEQTVERTVGLAPRTSPPPLPASISPSSVPGSVPELAGAWEAELPGTLTEGGTETATARRVGIEFDAAGRFSRVRLPHSTGYIAPAPAPTDAMTFAAPIELEYRPGGAHFVLAEREQIYCNSTECRVAIYDIDIATADGSAIITFHEHFQEPAYGSADALAYDFEGTGPAALRAAPVPGALTGCIDLDLEGTAQTTDFPGWPNSPVIHDPEPATRHTQLCMDSLGRVLSVTTASGRSFDGSGSYPPQPGSGNVFIVQLDDPEIVTESGFRLEADFHITYYFTNTSGAGASAHEVFALSSDLSGTYLSADVAFGSWTRYGTTRDTSRTHFTGTARIPD